MDQELNNSNNKNKNNPNSNNNGNGNSCGYGGVGLGAERAVSVIFHGLAGLRSRLAVGAGRSFVMATEVSG
ncbi:MULTISPECIES: hypothetical protein [unclassified Xanthomonas]|uniref:hypothetical protein n=1 Tax=Xanthomonas sp. LMG 8992 TaxID=1591157 RepID=UPI00136998E2|nr:hypothetical protein [Xanthomonas sp. LMG 8992]